MLLDRRFWLVSVVAAICGCARVSSPLSDNLGNNGGNGVPGGPGTDVDLAMPDAPLDLSDPSSPADLSVPARDLAMPRDLATPTTPPDLATPRDLSTPPDLTVVSSCHLVVNELQTETTQAATEEFVEVYNPCSAAVTVDGFKLVYRSATNTNPRTSSDNSTLYTFSGSIATHAYRVIAGAAFTGTKDGALASGLAASGSVGIRDASGALIDSVAYGSATGNTFAETASAPLPPTLASPGGSIERLPNGADSDDNSHDFAAASAATPGAANH
jgi:hypothetical protein